MKHVFRGPKHRVQLVSYTRTSEETREVTHYLSVNALPASSHPSTPFVRGSQVYRGIDPTAAWESVRALAPSAVCPPQLSALLQGGREDPLTCIYCKRPIQPHHRQMQISVPGVPEKLVWAHSPCISTDVEIDPKLLPRVKREEEP